MKKKTRIILATLIMAVSLSISYMYFANNKDKILFFDNTTFASFNEDKEEKFEIKKVSKVEFTFDTDISDGKIFVQVKDSNNKIIYSNDSMKKSDKFTLELQPGKYYYDLKATNAKGHFTYKAVIE